VSFASSSYDTKEQIRQAVDIVDLIGSHIPLRREGRGYKGICPWHDDTRPSLQVNPQRQSFKCWVCDIGGDIFSFVMKVEGVEFREALSMLAERAGIPLERPRGGGPTRDEKVNLYDVMRWANEQYHECLLHAPEAAPARAYLADRHITQESVRAFRLGFAPMQWDWLLERARPTATSTQTLEEAGLVGRSASRGTLYDRFRGRVLFPIRDVQGRPVAIGGRVLRAEADPNAAKYINSPETPLFSKHRLLYGLDRAREAIMRTRTAVVVEGYTDCIVAHQSGVDNTVAVLGTALGEQHIRLLRRFADRVILVLDGDDAGRRRANEVLELFIAEQVDLRIATLRDGLDPCDFLLQYGPDEFRRELEASVDALEHKFQVATRDVDLGSSPLAIQQALEQVLATLAKAPRLRDDTTSHMRLLEEQLLHRLARRFAVPEEAVRARLSVLRRGSRRAPADRSEASAPSAPIDVWERELLEALVQSPESLTEVAGQVAVESISFGPYRRILRKCADLVENGERPSFERLLLEFDELEMKNVLVDLDERGREKGHTDWPLRIHHLLERYRWKEEDQERRLQTAVLRESQLEESRQIEILDQIITQARQRQRTSGPTDG